MATTHACDVFDEMHARDAFDAADARVAFDGTSRDDPTGGADVRAAQRTRRIARDLEETRVTVCATVESLLTRGRDLTNLDTVSDGLVCASRELSWNSRVVARGFICAGAAHAWCVLRNRVVSAWASVFGLAVRCCVSRNTAGVVARRRVTSL